MVQLRLPDYQGPLDVLLQLIEKNELDVSELSLIQVTDQYLEQVARLQAGSRSGLADALAEFLVIGAKLMLLKSRGMLPHEVEPLTPEDQEDDVGRELVDMLEEYRRYRDATAILGTIDKSGLRSFRPGAPTPVERTAPLGLPDDVTLDILSKLVREALARADERSKRMPEVPLERDTVTVKDKIAELQRRLGGGRRVSFRTWIAEARNRVEVIVTFLVILELYKSRTIEMQQDETYGDIWVVAKSQAPDSAARGGSAQPTEEREGPPATDSTQATP